MDIQAILAAAASVAKPEQYQIGGNVLYLRRFTCAHQADFIKQCNEKTERGETITKFWVIAYGLCDDKGAPLFDRPEDGETVLQGLLIDDQIALEEIIMRKLGLPLAGTKKA